MAKKLSEMALEELWQLFPITLTEHQPCWEEWYREEEAFLQSFLPGVRLSHIGSTAIKGIWAKPIIDILAEAGQGSSLSSFKGQLVSAGYLCMAESGQRLSFNKGYTENGFAERVFHLHLRWEGDNDELFFRDYLNTHPATAKEYEKLKLSLWRQYEHDRDGYTQAKTDFVLRYTEKAKQELDGAPIQTI